jgi:hypothetical protein
MARQAVQKLNFSTNSLASFPILGKKFHEEKTIFVKKVVLLDKSAP